MDRNAVEAEVWCRRAGPIQKVYERYEIACCVRPEMPTFKALRKLSRNLYVEAKYPIDWLQSRQFREALLERIASFDLIHFNNESLYRLAAWMRRRHSKPQTMHIRTMPSISAFARRQSKTIARSVDHLVFITENEQDRFDQLVGRTCDGSVIYNIAAPVTVESHSGVPNDQRLKLAVLSNFDWQRGIDRTVEVAELLANRGRRDFLFVIAGDMRIPRSTPGALGSIGRRGGTLVDYATARGVSDMFLFLGHVGKPEPVIAACDVLVKPTRENNPWGRDILEALASCRPVISCGHYDRFVENNVTGYLLADYSPAAVADRIMELDADRELCRRLGQAGAQRVRELCDGPRRAAELLAIWQRLAVKHRPESVLAR